jgi:hypothetical protein
MSAIHYHTHYHNLTAEEVAKATPTNLDPDSVACCVVKSADERRYVLGLAYPAMRADKAVASDGHRDFVSPEVLEATAWSWMNKSREISLFHKAGTDGHAEVVESYIYHGPAWTTVSPVNKQEYTIEDGDWLLGVIFDEQTWPLVKAGQLNGWSPEGGARRTKASAGRLAQLRS